MLNKYLSLKWSFIMAEYERTVQKILGFWLEYLDGWLRKIINAEEADLCGAKSCI